MKEATLYEKLAGGNVRCALCSHRCKIAPAKRGVCGVRENREGTLYTLVYGSVIAANVDPIEKKPIYHVYPGSASYSIATVGCNFRCSFCQNHEISQMPREEGRIAGRDLSPREVVRRAVDSASKSIAYTYTEPTIFFEFARDTALLAREAGLKNIFVTNGFMTPEALDAASPWLDAANVDLKSFRDEFYRRQCGARLEPVLETLRGMRQRGIWVEVTTLVIPTLNDDEGELREIAAFIRSLGSEVPWHVSRFFPCYKLQSLSPTPVKTVDRAVEIGREAGLKHVYGGNVPGSASDHTYCPACGGLLIERRGYTIGAYSLEGSKCRRCGTPLAGIFS
ncbi:MAG: Pyruvate formate-lyase 1-activating enzyme [Syntrophaceae bacterium PtaB.Bin038]|nr:MAG: Pyruvate formate-lyase 1-activating enzyme [Syntrophaceae bacterium PtaB.Bin038]